MAGDDFHANDIHRANLDPVQREIDRFGPIARANFVAIQDEIDKPMTFGPSKEHATMTSPTQRRHDEILGRLDALIDVVQSTTARANLHRLLAEESAAERRGEPVDVTEEPPIGSQVTDKSDDVWERFADGWKLIAYRGSSVGAPGSTGVPWSEVRNYSPLRLTTDADRERVGLPVDTAPDVDPDEALAKAESEARHWRQCYDAAEYQTEQAQAEVERLTRERRRYDAMRASVNGLCHLYRHIRNTTGKTVSADLSNILDAYDAQGTDR